MAKGTRDVSLVIKAKNEASQALNTITSSLEKLRTSQTEVKTSSEQASDTLTRLGKSTQALLKKFNGNGPDKLALSLKRAADAVSALEGSVAGSIAEQKRLSAEQARAERQAKSLAASQDKITQAYNASKAAAAAAVADEKKLQQARSKAEATVAGSTEKMAKYQARLDAASAALEKTRDKQAKLRAEMEKGTTRKNAAADLAATDAALAKQTTRFEKAKQAIDEYAVKVRTAEGDIWGLSAGQETARIKTAAAQAEFDRQKQALASVRAEIKTNGSEIKKLTAEQDKLVTSLKQQEAALAGAKGDFASTEESLRDMKTQAATLAAELRSGLRNSIGQSVRQLADYKTSWKTAGAAITAAAKAGADFKNPSAELAKQIATARGAKESYNAMQAAIHKMRAELTAAGTDAVKLAAAQSKFKEALLEVDLAAEKAAEAVKSVGTAARSSKGDLEATEQTLKGAASASASLATSLTKNLNSGLVKATRTLRNYDAEWKQATAAIKAAAKAGADFKNPSAELAQQIQNAKTAKQSYNQLQQAMQTLRNEMAAAEGDTNKLKAAQKAFNATLKTTQTSMGNLTGSLGAAGSAASSTTSTINRLSTAQQRAARAAADNAAAHEALSRRGRQAMTWAQRMRAEAVALASAYFGIYGAIEQLRGVTEAFMTVEAAQNRMLTAFSGDENVVGRELRWTKQQAERLGIEFGTLANEYSKFAVATRGTELAGETTRNIFLSVAEAARVNKLSLEQTQGTFLALSQMVSKGVVSMEELRRQLGDRLVGAFGMAAEAMGKTTREMNELVASGQLLTVDLLPNFAKVMDRTFGPQLSKSLNTFTADLGRFKNEIFETQLSVAEAGFIEGLREALVELTEYMQSDEGSAFFYELGEALGTFLAMLAKIPENFEAIKVILAVLVGNAILGGLTTLRLRFIAAWQAAAPLPATLNGAAAASRQYNAAGGLVNTTNAAAIPLWQRMSTSVAAASGALSTVAGRAAVAASAMRGLRVAMAAVGGVPGLLITGAAIAWSVMGENTAEANAAARRHQELLDKIIDSYARAKQEGRDWTGSLEKDLDGVNVVVTAKALDSQTAQLESQIEESLAGMQRSLEQYTFSVSVGPEMLYDETSLYNEVKNISTALRDGRISARDYRDMLNEIWADDRASPQLKKLIENLADQNEEMAATSDRVAGLGTAYVELGGNLEDLPPIVQALITSLDEIAESTGRVGKSVEKDAADPMVEFGVQMDRLRGKIPGLKNELDLLANIAELDDILETASNIKKIDKMSEAWVAFVAKVNDTKQELRDAFDADRFSDAAEALTQNGSGRDLASTLIKRREGYREDPYEDNDGKLRAGFGSDTVTLADGSIKKVVAGMKVSATQANDDLKRRVVEFENIVKSQIGSDTYAGLSPQQQAVLISNAYNYGPMEDSLVAAILTGNDRLVSSVLKAQGDHNEGINRSRREEEAYLYSAGPELQATAQNEGFEDQLAEEQARVEARIKFNAEFDKSIAKQRASLELQQGIGKEEAMQVAVAEAVATAKEKGQTLTAAQIEQVRELAADTWNIAAAEKAIKEQKQQQQIEDQKLNDLTSTRQAIQQQIAFLQEHGAGDNGDAITELQGRLAGVNNELMMAIERAILFNEAMGNTAVVESLKARKLELTEMGNKLISVEQIQTTFASTATSGLMSMAEATANYIQNVEGSGNLWENVRNAFRTFAAEFLQQIAQMIIQQIIFNALQSMYGGYGAVGSAAGSTFAGIFHDGGVIGSSGGRGRQVSPALFAGAARYHSGGIAGLAPNEMPAILERGEEVLTRDDPRHQGNGSKSASTESGNATQKSTTIINTIDPGEMVSKGLGTPAGEKTIINFLSRNSGKVKQILG